MLETVEMDLLIRRHPLHGYLLDLRCMFPDSDAPIEPLGSGVPVHFDLARLNAATIDPETYGRLLCEMLFSSAQVAQAFASARVVAQRAGLALRLRLMIAADAAELQALRWETLHDPQTQFQVMLTTSDQVLFSRYLASPDWQPIRLGPLEALRALVVLANPIDLPDYGLDRLDVAAELELIHTSLGTITTTVLGQTVRATLPALIQQLRRGYDVVYLLAHGRTLGEQTVLYLEDVQGRTDPVQAQELVSQLAELNNRPRLIVLGVCESTGDGRSHPALALGPSLAMAGVPAVLAMQGRVTIETLRGFLPVLFSTLQNDGLIDRAVAIARSHVRSRPDFWSPVLFLRLASGRLWQKQAPGPTFFLPMDTFAEAQRLYHTLPSNATSPAHASDVLLQRGLSQPVLIVPGGFSAGVAHHRPELLRLLAARYTERLASARSSQVRLQIGLHTRPDAVDPAWRRLHLRAPGPACSEVWGRSLADLFDMHGGQLLILGAPGGGKTTLLIELARALVARAQAHPQERIPVVLHLASWQNGQRLQDWLIAALPQALGISKRFAAELIACGSLLLLLDGLDEVLAQHRAACVGAIARYLNDAELAPPLVVACRSHEYRAIGARLPLAGAVALDLLDVAAIERGLGGLAGAQDVLALIQRDPLLCELVRTPLMLNVLLLTQGLLGGPSIALPVGLAPAEELRLDGAHAQQLERRRADLWTAYVQRMFQQRPLEGWHIIQTLQWLRWLAQTLKRQHTADFLLDDLQPLSIAARRCRRWYYWLVYLTCGVPCAVAAGVIGMSIVCTLGSPIMMFCFVLGSIAGLVLFRFLCRDNIRREGYMGWSWAGLCASLRASWNIQPLMIISIMAGIWIGTVHGFSSIFRVALLVFLVGLVCLIDEILDSGWGVKAMKAQVKPGEGITRSLYTGILRLWILLSATGCVVLLIWHLAGQELLVPMLIVVAKLIVWFVQGFSIGPSWGLVGIGAFLKHYTLRAVLAAARLFPLRAVAFLDSMCARLLLERDGAVYRFRHILLRDFFAQLTDAQIEQIARGVSV